MPITNILMELVKQPIAIEAPIHRKSETDSWNPEIVRQRVDGVEDVISLRDHVLWVDHGAEEKRQLSTMKPSAYATSRYRIAIAESKD